MTQEKAESYAYIHTWECPTCGDSAHAENNLIKAYLAGHAEVGRWIDVRDKLPELNTPVFVVFNEIPIIYQSFLCEEKSEIKWAIPDGNISKNARVVYWMPLPKLPQGGERD